MTKKTNKTDKINKSLDAQSLKFTNHEWIAACGHELRIPISQIENCTEILEMDRVEPFLDEHERKLYFDNIKAANHSMSLLVEDLIDGAKNANHTFSINCKEINLKILIEQLHQSFETSAKVDVSLLLDYHSDAPALAFADPQRTTQVISNLIRNAIKFTQKGSITITVKNDPEKNDFLRISVSDTGIGMDSGQIQRVWDAFTKVYDISTTEADNDIDKGLGLGLALSSNFISNMGGEINVESTPGIGSTFFFTVRTKLDDRNNNG